jgi:fructose-bisphosphate aldolase, class II
MPLVPTREIIDAAVAGGRGVCAFNVITLEHAEAVATAAEAVRAPVILQVSENAVRYRGGRLEPIARAAAAVAACCAVPAALHLDHVTDDELMRQAPGCGFGSVMYDASARPYAENVARTAAAARWAHGRGLWIEAELGEVGGKDGEHGDAGKDGGHGDAARGGGGRGGIGAHAPGARTDPAEARGYVAATGVDALAVAVGSRHRMTARTATLDHDLIARLRAALAVPLVLHGSSGVADDELRRAVAHGMVKINIGTVLNVAFTEAIRRFVSGDGRTVDPRAYLSRARDAMSVGVRHMLATVSTSSTNSTHDRSTTGE